MQCQLFRAFNKAQKVENKPVDVGKCLNEKQVILGMDFYFFPQKHSYFCINAINANSSTDCAASIFARHLMVELHHTFERRSTKLASALRPGYKRLLLIKTQQAISLTSATIKDLIDP